MNTGLLILAFLLSEVVKMCYGIAESAMCQFPFVFEGKSYSTCTTEGRSDGVPWCATTANNDRDKKYAFCPNTAVIGGTSHGEPCQFPFKYKGNTYNSCTSKDSNYLWCATTRDFGRDRKWDYCLDEDMAVIGGNSDGELCQFPFKYAGNTYDSCTRKDSDEMWCATTSDYDRDMKWGYCPYKDTFVIGGNSVGERCQFPFMYRGHTYDSCTTTHINRLWCATTRDLDRDGKWSYCPNKVVDPIRLVNGDDSCSGRVEMYHDGRWGTVCDNSWDINDAEVACRQVGCGGALAAHSRAHFGQGNGPIWLDDLRCRGNESALTQCSHRGVGSHYCGHNKDAGVVCSVSAQIRLVNGDDPCSGRVEIYLNDQWGTVCNDSWDINDAEVACRQVGCGRALYDRSNAHFGQGGGPIWLDDLRCHGNESALTQCPHRGVGSHDCGHGEDAGVVCSVGAQIRLVNGDDPCSGRVEMYHDGRWGTVCDDSWDINDAEVACRQVGCGGALAAHSRAHFGQGSGPIWFNNLRCRGNESALTQCPHRGLGSHICGHHEDAGVVCSVGAQIRLVNGNDPCSGRVEIYHNDQWGTVCDNHWDINDAEVACRQVGCGRALAAYSRAHFGQGSGPIWLDGLWCHGNEYSLNKCADRKSGSHDCGHGEDAGVVCSVGAQIRLVNGNDPCYGRVEIYHNDQWGTVCDNHWDINDAEVACRQVGCGRAQAAYSRAYFGQGSGPIWLDGLWCHGNEYSLNKCADRKSGSHDCGHGEDAGVVCSVGGQIRLVNGDDPCSGRVEIYHNGQWGTVCDDSWDINDAEVACRQVGCGRALAAHSSAHFGQGSGPIWLDNLRCRGKEYALTECSHRGLGSHDCGNHKDAGVVCSVGAQIRLVNGDDPCSGRVEIYHNGQWGTVCHDSWDINNAEVACRQVGCGRALYARSNAHFGQGSGPIWLDDLSCRGNESALTQCPQRGNGSHNCVHIEDAGVVCSVSGTQGYQTTTIPTTPGHTTTAIATNQTTPIPTNLTTPIPTYQTTPVPTDLTTTVTTVKQTTSTKYEPNSIPIRSNLTMPLPLVCIHGQIVSGVCLCLDEWTGEFCQIPNFCNGTIINGFTFNKTVIDRFSYSSERCVGTANEGLPRASVQCLNKSGSLGFGPVRKLDCGLTLDDLQGNITGNSVIVSNTVLMLTSQPERLTPDNITSAAAIVTQLLKSTPTEEVAVAAVATVSQLLSANIPAVGTIDSSATNSLTSQLESFSLPQKKGVSLLVQPNLVVQSVGGLGGSRGVEFAALTGLSDQFVANIFNLNTNASQLSDDNTSALSVQIFIRLHPGASWEYASVGFVLYQNDLLFQSLKFKTPLGTTRLVISASIANGWRPVDVEMRLRFKGVPGTVLHDFACVFWNYSVSDWSTAGCRKNRISNVNMGCVCNHTSNFAVLMSFRNNYAYAEALNWISIVGCSLSIIGVSVTIIFQIFTRRSRKVNATLLPVCISFSLLVFYLLFMFGSNNHAPAPKEANVALLSDKHSERDSGSCTGITALLHYFLLATFTWNTLYATKILLLFLFPFARHQRPFTIAALVTGWGLPAAVVAVTLGATYRPQQPLNYRQEEFCWLAALDKEKKLDLKKPMIWGFLLPVALMLLFNCAVYVYFTVKTFRPDPVPQSTSSLKKKVLSSFSMSVVLGLSWVLGYLLLIDVVSSNNVISIMFCILTTTQGLQIFILHTARTPAFKKKLSELSIPLREIALH